VFSLNGPVLIEHVTGESVDISEYIDMSFYDWVHFVEGKRLEAPAIGRWLGIASHVGGCMTYYILKANGQVLARSTVSRVTNLKQQTKEEVKDLMAEFTKTVEARLKDTNFVINVGAKTQPEDWSLASFLMRTTQTGLQNSMQWSLTKPYLKKKVPMISALTPTLTWRSHCQDYP